MDETIVQLGPREQQIIDLLLQGCDNTEIAETIGMNRRTVKAHFNRLFAKFRITGGIKRVKLATLLYRRQLCLESGQTEFAIGENKKSSNWLPKGSPTVTSQKDSEPPSTSSKTIFGPSTTNWVSGTGSN
jgi:DNA-binding CsgD family transcriptional regulator